VPPAPELPPVALGTPPELPPVVRLPPVSELPLDPATLAPLDPVVSGLVDGSLAASSALDPQPTATRAKAYSQRSMSGPPEAEHSVAQALAFALW
jgi:hypothetical protein